MATENRSAQILIRIQPSLKAKMEEAARDEARSLSSFIEKVVSDWLRERNYIDRTVRELGPERAVKTERLSKDEPEGSD